MVQISIHEVKNFQFLYRPQFLVPWGLPLLERATLAWFVLSWDDLSPDQYWGIKTRLTLHTWKILGEKGLFQLQCLY